MTLSTHNLTFSYGNMPLLEDYHFSMEQNEIVGLLGPSGCGKSTFAKLLAGYLSPIKGEILLDGMPISPKGIYPVQLIHQQPADGINPRWTMEQVLREAGEIEPPLLEKLGIQSPWLQRYAPELSGGELQRFAIARALLAKPKFLVADEISTMLDGITQAQLWSVLLEEAERNHIGILVITHHQALAERLCHKTLVFSNKKSPQRELSI